MRSYAAESIKQERQQFADELEVIREQKFQLEAQLLEQTARREQEEKASQEKLSYSSKLSVKPSLSISPIKCWRPKRLRLISITVRVSMVCCLHSRSIEGFKKQVNDCFNQEAKERHTLVHEIKSLQKLYEQMTQEALNLTQALKGDNKQQGNWGEVVLARVLVESGLREGHEYQTQVSLQNDAGKRFQPDVLFTYRKKQVVDSKMALVAYERFFNADTDFT